MTSPTSTPLAAPLTRTARRALATAGLLGLLLGATACTGAQANMSAQPSAQAWTTNAHTHNTNPTSDDSNADTSDDAPRATAAPKAKPAKSGYERLDDSVTFPNW